MIKSKIINFVKQVPLLVWLYRKVVVRFLPGFNAYKNWIARVEPGLWEPVLPLEQQSVKFSIVIPVYNPPINFFKECIESIQAQSYKNWELVLVDDKSTDDAVINYLKRLALTDSRIEVVWRSENGHISQATNTGIHASSGKYICFVDHDDRLSPHALNEIAICLIQQPELEWVYSDEDFISSKNLRVSPHFKSDWNPYLLHAHNYITHLCTYKRSLLIDLGGCRSAYDGAQDYDLALRASIALDKRQIGHIAKVLYHWRIHQGSTSSSDQAKPYTVDAGRKALIDFLAEKHINAEVNLGNLDNFYQVKYLPPIWPKVSIIIPSKDSVNVLKRCIDSILTKTVYHDYEIIIIDNLSSCTKTLSYLNELKSNAIMTIVSYDKPYDYSDINNTAVKHAKGDIVVLMSNETEVINEHWLEDMVGLSMRKNVGCVGAKLLYSNDTIQHAGIILGIGGDSSHSHRSMKSKQIGYRNRPHSNQVLSAVTGACLAIRKTTYLELNGLDEEFKVAYNDVDFCIRAMKAGYYNVYCASALLYHHESKSRGSNISDDNKLRFDKEKSLLSSRHKDFIDNDPYYSPHLTRANENFTIRVKY